MALSSLVDLPVHEQKARGFFFTAREIALWGWRHNGGCRHHPHLHPRQSIQGPTEATGFASKLDIQTFSIAIIGTIVTKYLPESKRRFIEEKQ